MYKLIFWRYGKREVEEIKTLAEANRQFNYIGEFDIGFSDCIVDENNIIVRDGKKGVFGIKKENRKGTEFIFNWRVVQHEQIRYIIYNVSNYRREN